MAHDVDYDNVPGIAMTQWQAGRVLSEADVLMIERLLREHEAETSSEAAAFSAGYEQAMSECDRADVPTLIKELSATKGMLAFYKALASVAERQLGELKGRIAASASGT